MFRHLVCYIGMNSSSLVLFKRAGVLDAFTFLCFVLFRILCRLRVYRSQLRGFCLQATAGLAAEPM